MYYSDDENLQPNLFAGLDEAVRVQAVRKEAASEK